MAIEIIKDKDTEYRIDDEKGHVMILWHDNETNATYMAETQCHSDDMQHYSRRFGMELAEHRLMMQLGRSFLANTLYQNLKNLKHLLQTCMQGKNSCSHEVILINRAIMRAEEEIHKNKEFLKKMKQDERDMIISYAKRTSAIGQK